MSNLNSDMCFNFFDIVLLVWVIASNILLIIYILQLNKFKKDYGKFMYMLGDGRNFNDILKEYMNEVENVSRETLKLKNKTESVEKNIERCVQKVGVVRYKAYLDAGSDLCFALALLDFEDNGVVLNGIYSRDNTTTTYAKPIENGKSKYTLVKEEEEAIELARQNGYKYFLDINNKR